MYMDNPQVMHKFAHPERQINKEHPNTWLIRYYSEIERWKSASKSVNRRFHLTGKWESQFINRLIG